MIHTLFEAMLLVVIVVILFLQTWRAAIIPLLAIPVSLIGSFAVMAAVGISFNTLSLFGLVLAIGIVVDDAIVVVENVERYLTQGMSPKEAAHKTMDEVGGALIAISLVLIAVFLPTAFITGLQGTFYKQFAITIAASTAISAFVSLTLSPALAALLLKTHALSHVEKPKPTLLRPAAVRRSTGSSTTSTAASNGCRTATATPRRALVRIGVHRAGRLCRPAGPHRTTGWSSTPTGLVPQLDRSLPDRRHAAAARLDAGARRQAGAPGIGNDHGDGRASSMPCRFVGFDGATFTNAPNTGVIFVTLKPFERAAAAWPRTRSWPICAARCSRCARPSCSCSSRPRSPASAPAAASRAMCRTAPRAACRRSRAPPGRWRARPARRPASTQAFTLFSTSTPQIWAEIDRTKAEQLGVPIARVFETLSIYMGSAYVNDFNILGRTYRVTAQADNPYRLTLRDVANLKTRSASGEMVPIGSVATFSDTTGPYRVARYNLYPAAEVQVALERGFSSGQGIAAMEGLARQGPAVGLRLRMDRNRAAGKARRQHRDHGLRPGRAVRLPAAGGALRELAAAARRHPDRADVHPGGDDRRQHPRARPQHPGRDRPGGAGRASRPRTPS